MIIDINMHALPENLFQNGVEYIKSLDISEEEKEQIFCGNAKKLFGIK